MIEKRNFGNQNEQPEDPQYEAYRHEELELSRNAHE